MLLHGLAIEVYGRWGDDFSYMFNHFIPRAILANYWRRRISVCLQSGVSNAINTRINRLTARTLGAGGLHSSHGEAFFRAQLRSNRRHFETESLLDGTLTEVKVATGSGRPVRGTFRTWSFQPRSLAMEEVLQIGLKCFKAIVGKTF